MTKQRNGFCLQCRYGEMGNYCRVCGSRLVDISLWDMKCKCGKLVEPQVVYCDECGERTTMDSIILYLEKRDEVNNG